MSFYMGGQRFKSRAPVPSQPPQFQPSSENPDVHPLRQHSISQDNSPTIPTKQPMAANPTSYAARANGQPPLSLDTSPLERTQPSYNSPGVSGEYADTQDRFTPTASRRQSRKSSVPGRSPLQKLEGKLGDISKEEKRARVEEAERDLRSRRERGVAPTRSIPRKPVAALNGDGDQHGAQQQLHKDRGGHAQHAMAGNRPQRQSSLGLEGFPSRDRRYGYDSSRTGGAAAAAVGAYQSARHPNFDQYEQPTEEHFEQQPRYSQPQHMTQAPTRASQPSTRQVEEKSTGNRNPNAIPKAQRVLGSERTGTQAGAEPAHHVQAPDPVHRDQVRRHEPGMNYDAPPQTAAGQDAREAVGLDNEEAAPEEYGGRGGRLKFSQVIHPFSDGTGRRFKDVEYLQDWKNAPTGTLTAVDLDSDLSADQQAWWEREKHSRSVSRGRTSAAKGFAPANHDDRSGRTAFNPPLSLKCGPLLRYTGMRGDKNAAATNGRTFWRGSVMILTEDATSSTEAPPTLRLFSQHTDLYQSPVKKNNQLGHEEKQPVEDPIAGQPKCGFKGQTLYVKHVSYLTPECDLSLVDDERGLFTSQPDPALIQSRQSRPDGEKLGRFKEVKGHRLHHERGLTFWRFNIEVELGPKESRIAYRINGGPVMAFWVPARGQSMNIMFHSCNGFSLSVDPNKFSGPDPLWRDVLNTHQSKPFHVMIGGGDQIYNDAAMRDTHHFQEWLAIKNPEHKYGAPFSEVLQEELEKFYLHRYAMWFQQGLFGMANSQIPMVNIWDDHDIIDGYGSYPHHFMSCPVFTGLGAVAFKYYMLFQHQSLPAEDHQTEPSWILGPSRGPYINQQSRSVFMSLGHQVALVGVDCRTERMRDEVLSHETYEVILDRLDREVQKGEVKHLLVLLGIPIAYPRMTFAENILTSRAMDPIKALARTGIMGGVLNKFDGGVEVLDDLDDHWTAKHHKTERNWLIQDLQDYAAEKSVRITILGGDVHLAAVGQFYSKKKLAIPKDHDHRYIPNIISSAIVNTPPPEAMADFLNKRNKVHHLDHTTDEDMIPLFTYDVDGRDRNNHHLLPRRNYCTIRPYTGDVEDSPPGSVFDFDEPPPKRRRSFSLTRRNSASSQDFGRKPSLLRRLSGRVAPPSSYRGPADDVQDPHNPCYASGVDPRVDGPQSNTSSRPSSTPGSSTAVATESRPGMSRNNSFVRRPMGGSEKTWAKDPSGRQGHIDLTGGLEIVLRCEINQKDPSGKTQDYRLLVPALDYQTDAAYNHPRPKRSGVSGLLGSIRRNKHHEAPVEAMPYEANEPATPAMAGDQRYTTMMENQEQAALGTAHTYNTDRVGAAKALDGTTTQQDGASSPGDWRDRATFNTLPRSGVVETEMAEVPRQPYHEQRRGSLDQNRGHSSAGRNRSLSDRSNSHKRASAEHGSETAEDRAYRGAQLVRGELPASPTAAGYQKERGLRRYYASPFGSSKRQDPNEDNLPTKGLAPPLGAVNNRVDLMPARLPDRSASNSNQHHRSGNDGRRVISDPVQNVTQAKAGQSADRQSRPAEKDPYAHYLPEAVEAEYQSDEDISDLDDVQHGHTGYDGVSEMSSPEADRHKTNPAHAKPRGESFASAQTNTSLAQNHAQEDSPLYSDEDDLDHMTQSRLSDSSETPTRSLESHLRNQTQPQSRPLSKVERLTGASNSGQRASYASGGTMPSDVDPQMARPVGQGASGKVAKMLGPEAEAEMNGYDNAGVGRTQSAATGGRLGGLMRRFSERGDKTRKRLSTNGGVR